MFAMEQEKKKKKDDSDDAWRWRWSFEKDAFSKIEIWMSTKVGPYQLWMELWGPY